VLTAYCLLLTAYCLLLTAYCLLLTAYCLRLCGFASWREILLRHSGLLSGPYDPGLGRVWRVVPQRLQRMPSIRPDLRSGLRDVGTDRWRRSAPPFGIRRLPYFFRYWSTLLWSTTSVPVSTTAGTFFPAARSFKVLITSMPIL
jgi:hypothetical protein